MNSPRSTYKKVSETGTYKPMDKQSWVNVPGEPKCLHQKKVI